MGDFLLVSWQRSLLESSPYGGDNLKNTLRFWMICGLLTVILGAVPPCSMLSAERVAEKCINSWSCLGPCVQILLLVTSPS